MTHDCPECGRGLAKSARQCPGCGAELVWKNGYFQRPGASSGGEPTAGSKLLENLQAGCFLAFLAIGFLVWLMTKN